MNWVSSCCRVTLGAGCKLFPRYSNEHFTYLPMKRNSDELKPRSIHYQSCITRHIFINRLDTRILSSARTRRNVKFNSVCLMYYVTFAIHPCGAKLQVFSSALVVAHLNPPARARTLTSIHPETDSAPDLGKSISWTLTFGMRFACACAFNLLTLLWAACCRAGACKGEKKGERHTAREEEQHGEQPYTRRFCPVCIRRLYARLTNLVDSIRYMMRQQAAADKSTKSRRSAKKGMFYTS